MIPNQLYPLEVNPQTQEPFLRLRKHKNVILTPMRWEDAPHFIPIFNDPRVYEWLLSPPIPYSLKDAEDWLRERKPQSDAILQELKDAQGSDVLKIVDGAPVCFIREVQEDDTEIFLGCLDVCQCFDAKLIGTDICAGNLGAKLDVGDPKIIWSIGDYLAPSHHRRGIMTDAIDTLLHDWAIPRMNVRHVLVGAFIGNHGSVRVFEKNGFNMARTIEEYSIVRGKMRGMHVLEWKLVNDGNVVSSSFAFGH
ncbi:hypothetical protein GALMADRAFT_218684 [Galerina marginata CBS 339.88]|uniref:N-acetyltransferase domain-containing protein n=1 Tax=Galerina marginata (strain CBS 339.88) TaxID=685588 RepID=A0A067U2G5_GALM3|nr:hypothetical protein GALMADRAFT_218684 [Galerina marginata CBS 339.88]